MTREDFNEQCEVTCTDNDRTVTANVMFYTPKKNLTVILVLKWNGRRVYVGNALGMEFTSTGPDRK